MKDLEEFTAMQPFVVCRWPSLARFVNIGAIFGPRFSWRRTKFPCPSGIWYTAVECFVITMRCPGHRCLCFATTGRRSKFPRYMMQQRALPRAKAVSKCAATRTIILAQLAQGSRKCPPVGSPRTAVAEHKSSACCKGCTLPLALLQRALGKSLLCDSAHPGSSLDRVIIRPREA